MFYGNDVEINLVLMKLMLRTYLRIEYLTKIILSSLSLLLILCGCDTCRKISVEDALYWESKGFKSRIVVYETGIDGKILGLGIWKYHAQAQVYKDEKWMWAEGENLYNEPTYTLGGEIYYWQTSIYKAVLIEHGKYD